MNIEILKRFTADYTDNLDSFKDVSIVCKKLVNHYAKCYSNHNFSYRILLQRSGETPKANNISRKLGLQLQNEMLSGIRNLKLRPNIKEYRYVHDDSHFGWLLLDPALTNRFN